MKKLPEVYIRGYDNMPKIAQTTLLEMARIVCQAVIEGRFEGATDSNGTRTVKVKVPSEKAPSVSKRTVRIRRKTKPKR